MARGPAHCLPASTSCGSFEGRSPKGTAQGLARGLHTSPTRPGSFSAEVDFFTLVNLFGFHVAKKRSGPRGKLSGAG